MSTGSERCIRKIVSQKTSYSHQTDIEFERTFYKLERQHYVSNSGIDEYVGVSHLIEKHFPDLYADVENVMERSGERLIVSINVDYWEDTVEALQRLAKECKKKEKEATARAREMKKLLDVHRKPGGKLWKTAGDIVKLDEQEASKLKQGNTSSVYLSSWSSSTHCYFSRGYVSEMVFEEDNEFVLLTQNKPPRNLTTAEAKDKILEIWSKNMKQRSKKK
jgi:hypothetical protein